MRKFIMRCLGVVTAIVVAQFALAEVNAGVFNNDCNPCEEISECNPCDEAASCDPCAAICGTKKSKWFVNGYLEAGVWANEYGQKNLYRSDINAASARRSLVLPGNGPLQNVSQTGFQVNQLYVSAGKSVDGRYGWDFGGTVDFTFGTDAELVQAAGLEKYAGHGLNGDPGDWGTGDYYSAFAQAYFEAAYKKWNIKAGKFYAPFGSNGYKSTDRFFYSLADTYAFVPATAGGAYATYTVNSELAVYGGWVTPDSIGYSSEDNFFLGGIVWQASKKLNLHYAFALGNLGDNNYAGVRNTDVDIFVQSLVTTYQINKKWKYVFDWSLLNASFTGGHRGANGINNELIYQYNSKWAFGARAGWTLGYGGWGLGNDNKYTFSLGANWTPTKWLVIKPELRYDKYENLPMFNQGQALQYWLNTADGNGAFSRLHEDQLSAGVSAIVKF